MSTTVTEAGRIGGKSKSDAKARAARENGKLGGRRLPLALNDDGVSVRGCKFIYAPKGQAGEYAPLAANLYRGCGHACAYCYVPIVLKMPRSEFNRGALPRDGILANLEADAKKYQSLNISEQVMLSFTCDPYPVEHHLHTRRAIEILQAHGLGVCVLTKGGTRALRDVNLFRPSRDAFACTLTSLDETFQKKWEPGAASPSDRISALEKFHEAGVYTWVSLEPTLDADASLAIVDATHQYVDLYKVGRVNYSPMTKTVDWRDYTCRIIDRLSALGKDHYIKHDLQRYLPAGYSNPLRRQQHH